MLTYYPSHTLIEVLPSFNGTVWYAPAARFLASLMDWVWETVHLRLNLMDDGHCHSELQSICRLLRSYPPGIPRLKPVWLSLSRFLDLNL